MQKKLKKIKKGIDKTTNTVAAAFKNSPPFSPPFPHLKGFGTFGKGQKKARLHREIGLVASTGVEPVTHGFSVRCSTN